MERYLDRVSRDATRAKQAFASKIEEAEGGFYFRYEGSGSGRGRLFKLEDDPRIFFLELGSDGKPPSKARLLDTLKGFEVSNGTERERWSLLGLDVSLPASLSLSGKELKAGKTQISLAGIRTLVVAERWGFATQLLAKHGLEDWSVAVAGLGSPEVFQRDEGIELRQARRFRAPVRVLVRPQLEQNQITLIRSETRREELEPQWDWFN